MPGQPSPVGSAVVYSQKWAFNVEVENVSVGGFSKAGPLGQTFGVAEQREGGKMVPTDVTPTFYKTEKLMLERGSSDNQELWIWWNNQKQGIIDKRTVTVNALDSQQNVTAQYVYLNCVMTKWVAGEYDAKSETDNAIEQCELTPTDMSRNAP